MKTLQDIVLATEARGAKAVISMMRGSPKLKDCFLISAFSGSGMKGGLAVVMIGPDHTADDASFDYYLADLDDPKTWLSSGVEPPRRAGQEAASSR
jgi:hypothetical protein